jgi:hypothetical protein
MVRSSSIWVAMAGASGRPAVSTSTRSASFERATASRSEVVSRAM